MPAKVYNLYIEKGATWSALFYATDATGAAWPLATYTPVAQIKSSAAATTPVATLTTAKVTIDGKEYIEASLTDEQAAALPAGGARYSQVSTFVWEMDLIGSDGTKVRLFEGDVSVAPGGLS